MKDPVSSWSSSLERKEKPEDPQILSLGEAFYFYFISTQNLLARCGVGTGRSWEKEGG